MKRKPTLLKPNNWQNTKTEEKKKHKQLIQHKSNKREKLKKKHKK